MIATGGGLGVMQHCMCASAYHDMHCIVYILCVHTNTIYTPYVLKFLQD